MVTYRRERRLTDASWRRLSWNTRGNDTGCRGVGSAGRELHCGWWQGSSSRWGGWHFGPHAASAGAHRHSRCPPQQRHRVLGGAAHVGPHNSHPFARRKGWLSNRQQLCDSSDETTGLAPGECCPHPTGPVERIDLQRTHRDESDTCRRRIRRCFALEVALARDTVDNNPTGLEPNSPLQVNSRFSRPAPSWNGPPELASSRQQRCKRACPPNSRLHESRRPI